LYSDQFSSTVFFGGVSQAIKKLGDFRTSILISGQLRLQQFCHRQLRIAKNQFQAFHYNHPEALTV
jgi:hypothetical protein